MITSYQRGHKIYFQNGAWFYLDNNESVTIERSCKRCGKTPTEEGHDACLGHINGVKFACCGHGITEPVTVMIRN
jgi:hypothetical protein